jgi:hypothetical protein
MEPILVPETPKSAFNKNRRVSDLIRKQVEHFKHLEHKLPPEIRATLPQHAIVSEDDAARYIGPMTRFLLSRKAAVAKPGKSLLMKAPASPEKGLALAASAASDAPVKKTSGSGAAKKPASGRKRKK